MSSSRDATPPEPGGLSLLNLTQWSYALRLQSSRLLMQIANRQGPAVQRLRTLHRFEPKVMRSLQPRTIKTYQRQITKFVTWLEDRGISPSEPHEWVCAYLVPESEQTVDIGDDLEEAREQRAAPCSRSQAENLLAGVEKVLPRLKHQLVYIKAMLKDWKERPVQQNLRI